MGIFCFITYGYLNFLRFAFLQHLLGRVFEGIANQGYKDSKKRTRGFFRNGRMQNPPLRQEIVD